MRETIKLTREVLSGLASLCVGSEIEHEGIKYKVKKSDVSDLNPSKHIIVFKRQTDGKYFKFPCLIEGPYTGVNDDYNYSTDFPNTATEVFPRITFD